MPAHRPIPTGAGPVGRHARQKDAAMPFITTRDGTEIFYKDWGPKEAQPIMFHHGWPLSADDWDNQLMFFMGQGYRVVAHDRRGHGRSTQSDTGNDMDTYVDDVTHLVATLGLRNAIHVGHSTGGGEVARYVARAEAGAVSKAVLISAITPVMLKSEANPCGTPIAAFDAYRAGVASNRAQIYLDIASGPFYGFNRTGVLPAEGVIRNWWRQAMMGGIKPQYDCIKVFSETDLTEDLKQIHLPVLLIHSEDDQVVPYADSAPLAVMLLQQGQLKTYSSFPHGCITTHPDEINQDIVRFLQGEQVGTRAAEAPALVAEPIPTA
jgi:non-heme chloroperoxidase